MNRPETLALPLPEAVSVIDASDVSKLERRKILAVLALVSALAGCASQYQRAPFAKCTSAAIVKPVRDLRAGEQIDPGYRMGKIEGTVRDCRGIPLTAITAVATAPNMAGWKIHVTDDRGYFSMDVPVDEDNRFELRFYRKCNGVPSPYWCKGRPVLALTEVEPREGTVLPLEVVLRTKNRPGQRKNL